MSGLQVGTGEEHETYPKYAFSATIPIVDLILEARLAITVDMLVRRIRPVVLVVAVVILWVRHSELLLLLSRL